MEKASSTIKPNDLEWILPSSSAIIGPTAYISLENGLFILAQLAYSSLNSWSPSVQITVRIYGPEDIKKAVNISEQYYALELSDDKLSAECGQLRFKFLHEKGLGYQITFDSPEVSFDIECIASAGGFKVKDGQHHFDDEMPSNGWINSKFIPKVKCTGKLVIDDKHYDSKGHGTITFVTQMQPQNIARFNFCMFQNEEAALMLYQFHLPKGSRKKQVSQAALVLENQVVAITLDNQTIFHAPELDDFCNHPIPKAITHEWKGRTESDEEIHILLNLNLTKLVDKIDVLAELPYLLRMFVQTFVTAPYVYQWIEDATIVVTKGDSVTEFKGRAFHETTFMSNID